ncbi:MAG: CPBP family intramembrane glutamic endopeptidase [Candidatus Sulfotelmatobacter sp.]
MDDESHTALTTENPNDPAPNNASDPPNAPLPAEPKPWGRIDRIRLLIWAGISFAVPFALVYGLHVAGRNPSVLTVQSELPIKVFMAFFVSLATWVVSRIEKRSLGDYGIPLRQAFGARFCEGSAWGFAMLSAILLVLRLSGHFQIDSAALAGGAVIRWALAWGATFLAVSFNEELAFRGYWLFSMSRRMRFWPAALFLSGVFAVAHLGNHGETIMGILQVVATGLLLCLMIRRTGTLWFAIGFHAAWDWAETFFYGTPDSGLLGAGRLLNTSVSGPNWITGGSAGPEGSIFAMVILALCAALVHFRFPKVIYPDRPV